MKKSDLKTGMIVTTKEGIHYRVMLNTTTSLHTAENILVTIDNDDRYWLGLRCFNENLENGDFTIMKIEVPKTIMDLVGLYKDIDKETIWERPEPIKEITMEELEEHFGCKVKIVK